MHALEESGMIDAHTMSIARQCQHRNVPIFDLSSLLVCRPLEEFVIGDCSQATQMCISVPNNTRVAVASLSYSLHTAGQLTQQQQNSATLTSDVHEVAGKQSRYPFYTSPRGYGEIPMCSFMTYFMELYELRRSRFQTAFYAPAKEQQSGHETSGAETRKWFSILSCHLIYSTAARFKALI